MRCAILIICHKNPKQVNLLINALQDSDFDFYVHPDKKTNIEKELIAKPNVFIVPKEQQVNVQWAQISMVDATLELLKHALIKKYDYYLLLSGQDLPIRSVFKIKTKLSENPKTNYIHFSPSYQQGGVKNNFDKRNDIYYPQAIIGKKLWQRITRRIYVELTGGYHRTFKWFKRQHQYKFYFGSQWWCLNRETIEWMMGYLQKHDEFYHYYVNCTCSDESFFQTLFMMSPFANNRKSYLHYVDWPDHANSPKKLTIDDYEKIISSDKLFARKIDLSTDKLIIEKILEQGKERYTASDDILIPH